MLGLYRGWIPTVAGKLSYRVIGDTKHPEPCIRANSIVGDHRYILCYQKRDLSDAVHSKLTLLRSFSGDFRFVFIGRVKLDLNAINLPLYGHIYLFKDLRRWRSFTEGEVRQCQQFIYHYQHNLDEQAAIENRVVESIHTLKRRLDERADIAASVVLKRTGELLISRVVPRQREFMEASIDLHVYANLSLPDIVAAQFYYFLRDISHTHQHHNKNTDTILSIHKSDNDIDWRKNVLFSLYNHIIARKRTSKLTDSVQALGILAYAHAFYAICRERLAERHVWNTVKHTFPTFLDEPLTDSIKATLEQQKITAQEAAEIRAGKWNKFFGLIGIVLTTLAILYEFGGHEPIENALMACLVKSARQNIFMIIALLPAVYCFLNIVMAGADIRQWRLVRFLMRVLLAFPRLISIMGLVAFGIILMPYAWHYATTHLVEPTLPSEILNNFSVLYSSMASCF